MGNEKFYSSGLWIWVQEKPTTAMQPDGTYVVNIETYLKKIYEHLQYDCDDAQYFEGEMELAQTILGVSFEDQQYQEMIASLLDNN